MTYPKCGTSSPDANRTPPSFRLAVSFVQSDGVSPPFLTGPHVFARHGTASAANVVTSPFPMTTRIDADPAIGAITLKQLREFIEQFPDSDAADQPHQVLVQTGFAESFPIQCITLVGRGCDILLQTSESLDALPE